MQNDLRKWMRLVETEGAIPPTLFHGTGFQPLIRILALNSVTGNDDDRGGSGIFTSADITTAIKYTTAHDHPGGVLVLNSAKIIAAGFDVAPYVYSQGPHSDGVEYLINTDHHDLRPADQFLSSIRISKQNLTNAAAAFRADRDVFFDLNEWKSKTDYLKACGNAFHYHFEVAD